MKWEPKEEPRFPRASSIFVARAGHLLLEVFTEGDYLDGRNVHWTVFGVGGTADRDRFVIACGRTTSTVEGKRRARRWAMVVIERIWDGLSSVTPSRRRAL